MCSAWGSPHVSKGLKLDIHTTIFPRVSHSCFHFSNEQSLLNPVFTKNCLSQGVTCPTHVFFDPGQKHSELFDTVHPTLHFPLSAIFPCPALVPPASGTGK